MRQNNTLTSHQKSHVIHDYHQQTKNERGNTLLQGRSDGSISSNHGIFHSVSFISAHSISSVPNRASRILSRFTRRSNPSMKPSTSTNKMCIINRRNNTHDTSTPSIYMAEI